MMKLLFKKMKRDLIVRLEGELDLHTAADFKEAIVERVGPKTERLILNLDSIKFIDSSGLGAILSTYKKINNSGGELLISNVTPQVRRLFELSGILKIINVYEGEKEALDNILRG